MKRIENFILPEHTNTLYEKEAISSISLTKEVAKKINELVNGYNELSEMDLKWKQTQEGTIRKAVVYMKDNLLNSLNDLMVLLRDSGFIDDRIEYHCQNLKERLDNLLGSITEGSTSLDSELIDVRLDTFGNTHKTAGESIRNSFEALFNHTKNIYLDSVDFYSSFDNISWQGDKAYNRIANTNLFNLANDIKVTAPYLYQVSITIWKDGNRVSDTGWLESVIIPKGFEARLCMRKTDDTAISTSDIYRCSFEIDNFTSDIIPLNLSYTSGGAYSPIRIYSGQFEASLISEVIAPEGYSVALRLLKRKEDNSLAVYKDTGWCYSVTVPIGYVCELNFKKNDDSQIFKSELNNFTFRYGSWNDKALDSVNESVFRDIMNSITYGGWTTETHTYNDTTFTRMVTGIFKVDKTLKLKALNSNSKVALHLWKNNELGSESYLSASSWQSECIIPKDRYFTLYFSGVANNPLMQLSELECYSLTEYSSVIAEGLVATENENVKSIAHMGYSLEAPENTLSAYRLAYNKGFKYVECDISFTKDNIPVLLHDSTIDRTSNGTGNISELNYNDVSGLDFGSWFGSSFVGEKIPTAEEFLKLCRNYGLHPYLEIKYGATSSHVKTLVDTVSKCGMKGKVTYISFEKSILEYVKTYDDSARMGYIVNNCTSSIISEATSLRTDKNEVFIDCNYSSVNEEAVTLCINGDLELETWTVDDTSIIKNMNVYVTGFTSNYLIAGKILLES